MSTRYYITFGAKHWGYLKSLNRDSAYKSSNFEAMNTLDKVCEDEVNIHLSVKLLAQKPLVEPIRTCK